VAAKTVYSSSSSDNGEIMGSCAPKCSLLQESPVRHYPLYWVSVHRYDFWESHHLTI